MSNSSDPTLQPETVEELKREIDRLTEVQQKALDRATYFGMTPEQAKEVAERRRVITGLVDRLAASKSSN